MPYFSADDLFYNPNPKPIDKKEVQSWVNVLEYEIEIETADKNSGVMLAIQSLLNIGDPDTARVLLTVLTANPKTSAWGMFKPRQGIFRPELDHQASLATIIQHSSDTYVIDLILDILVKPDGFEKWQLGLLSYLLAYKPDERALRPLLSLLPYHEIRWQVALALGNMESRRATLSLIECLKDGHACDKVIQALGKIKDERAIEPLIAYLNDSNKDVRQAARLTLFRLGYIRPIDELRNPLRSEQDDERVEAVQGLAFSNHPDAIDLIIEMANDKSYVVRNEVMHSLKRLKDVRGFNTLVNALSDEAVQSAALLGLQALGDKRAVQPLLKMLNEHPYPAMIAQTLGNLGDKRAVQPLIEALKHQRSDVRAFAADALGKLGDKTVTEALVPLLNDKSTYRAAHRALKQLGYNLEDWKPPS